MAAGCGGGDGATVAGGGQPGGGGTLRWAVAERAVRLDPLYARTPADRLVSRQIHEPLVEELSGPFEDPRRVPGLALSIQPSAGATVWQLRLRPGVRFQDGTPLDAQAVLANVRRWQASGVSSAIPPSPGLLVDAPKPGLVRFILAEPEPGFDQDLSSPRLGIVSERALVRSAGAELTLGQVADSGTGPYELREHDGDGTLLAPNADWWGTERSLGPAVDQLEFSVVPAEAERAALLSDGGVQVASGLGTINRQVVAEDPLLTVLAEGIAAERSVRGIPLDEPVPSLNGVWQTRIDID